MRCYCCDSEVRLGRKVSLQVYRPLPRRRDVPDPDKYPAYTPTVFRWRAVCLRCYRELDNGEDFARIGKGAFNLDGPSRGDLAPVVDNAEWKAFQKRKGE
jgi:hypothetical protein